MVRATRLGSKGGLAKRPAAGSNQKRTLADPTLVPNSCGQPQRSPVVRAGLLYHRRFRAVFFLTVFVLVFDFFVFFAFFVVAFTVGGCSGGGSGSAFFPGRIDVPTM